MYHKWVSIIIIGLWRALGLGAEVFGQSTTLCSNWWQYPLIVWWWCCGDGVVNGGSAGWEECDYGSAVNGYNETFVTVHPNFNNIYGCNSSCSKINGAPNSPIAYPTGICPYYRFAEPVYCDGGVAKRNGYNGNGTYCGEIFLDSNMNFPICGTPICGNNYYDCAVGSPVQGNGSDTWKCYNGGLKYVSCTSTPTTPSYSYRRCASWPTWYNYGSPGNTSGPLTSCSTETTLGSAYAVDDFVCRGSQPSNSICDKSCTQTVDCDGVCGGTATDYNGATAWCGTAPTATSCSNMPTNAVACNTATPSSNASFTLVENCSSPDVACQAKCAVGTTYNGGVCVNNLKAYQCGSDGDWSQPPVSCAQQTSYVNTADNYTAWQSVCLLLSDTAPTNDTCANPTSDVKCGVTPWTCDLGSYVNGSDNGSLACNTTRQWQCRNAANTTTLSCNKTNYCNYACNGSSCEATIAWTYSSPSCDSACVVVDPPRCGDGIVLTNRWEECDGTAWLTAGQSCNASCQN